MLKIIFVFKLIWWIASLIIILDWFAVWYFSLGLAGRYFDGRSILDRKCHRSKSNRIKLISWCHWLNNNNNCQNSSGVSSHCMISILMAGCLAFPIYKYPCQAAEHNWLDNLRSLAAAPVAAAHLLTLHGGSFGNRSVIVLWPNHENEPPLSHHTHTKQRPL